MGTAAQDGYPFQALGRKGRSSWPNFTLADANNTTLHTGLDCRIAYDRCFPARLTRASDVFTHIAFENIECGDCGTPPRDLRVLDKWSFFSDHCARLDEWRAGPICVPPCLGQGRCGRIQAGSTGSSTSLTTALGLAQRRLQPPQRPPHIVRISCGREHARLGCASPASISMGHR